MVLGHVNDLRETLRTLPCGAALLDAAAGRHDAHLVGGAVRDLLRGGRPAELDVAVEGDTTALLAALGGLPLRHERFGTATVQAGDCRIDVAMTRAEDYPAPGALPCPASQAAALSAYPTRLADVPDLAQERLINWGYAICDAAMRAHRDLTLQVLRIKGARRVGERHGAEAVARRQRRAGADQPTRQRLAPGVGGAVQRHVQLQCVGGGGDQIELAGALAARRRHEGRRLDGRLLGECGRDGQQTSDGAQV